MMNDKMEKIAYTIESIMKAFFPAEYLGYLCEESFSLRDIAVQVMVECCKNAYDEVTEKHSIRYYRASTDFNEDSERMMISRTIAKIFAYREKEYLSLKNKYGIELPGLLQKKKADISEKLEGYKYTPLQYWEITDVHDSELENAILTRRIGKKNTTNEEFLEYAAVYDATLKSLRDCDDSNNTEYVFNALAAFILEWKYNFNFFYCVATDLEQRGMRELPNKDRIAPFCAGIVNFQSSFFRGESISTDNRYITKRNSFTKYILDSSDDDWLWNAMRYVEAIASVTRLQAHMTYENIPIREWFIQYTSVDDWASILKEADLFSAIILPKEWTPKKIRFVKQLYNTFSIDYKNPDFRS